MLLTLRPWPIAGAQLLIRLPLLLLLMQQVLQAMILRQRLVTLGNRRIARAATRSTCSAVPIDLEQPRSGVAPTVRDAQQRCELRHDASEASEVFSDQVLERRIVEHLLGQQLLQPAVLASRARSLRASDTSRPPNFDFHL